MDCYPSSCSGGEKINIDLRCIPGDDPRKPTDPNKVFREMEKVVLSTESEEYDESDPHVRALVELFGKSPFKRKFGTVDGDTVKNKHDVFGDIEPKTSCRSHCTC